MVWQSLSLNLTVGQMQPSVWAGSARPRCTDENTEVWRLRDLPRAPWPPLGVHVVRGHPQEVRRVSQGPRSQIRGAGLMGAGSQGLPDINKSPKPNPQEQGWLWETDP